MNPSRAQRFRQGGEAIRAMAMLSIQLRYNGETQRLPDGVDAMNVNAMDEAQKKRLYWHSRRGMWELDLLLVPFYENCFDALSAEQQQAYAMLLAQEDQDLFVWLMRREWPDDKTLRPMVQQIVDYAENTRTRDVRPV